MARLDGKVAVVTGAGRGVGRAYALALATEGAAVVVNDHGGTVGGAAAPGSAPADAVVAEIEAAGGRAVANHDSVADFAGAERIMDAATETFGRLDVLVANAGIIRPTYLREATEGDWADVFAVHAHGTFNCVRHAVPRMVDGGSIVTTGALTTDVYFPRIIAYRAAKAAIAVLTVHLAEELTELGITINSIMPGPTTTRMAATFFASLADRADGFVRAGRDVHGSAAPPEDRAVPPEWVPPLGVYLCTPAARHITGRLFSLFRDTVTLVDPDARRTTIGSGAGPWTVDDLEKRFPELLAGAR